MINIGSTKIEEMYVGSTKIAQAYVGSTKVYEAAPHEFETFYFLSYCQQAKNVSSSSNTNIRYYEKGVAKESPYSDNPTRLGIVDLESNFGTFKGVHSTTVHSPSNWTTYQMQIPFTQDMANALIGDNGLQLEFVFKLETTGSIGASTNYARYVPINMGYLPKVMSYGSGYGYSNSTGALDSSPVNTITNFTGNTNGFTFNINRKYIFLPSNSTLGTTPHHLVITVSKKNQFIRIWLDGVLSINTSINITDSDSTILGKVGSALQGWQMANVKNLIMTQIGVREAIWKDATNYTPPSQAYLAVADYF